MPEDDPAVKCSGFHGLRAGGAKTSKLGPPSANSCVVSLPISTVPAAANREAQVASAAGMLPSSNRDWQVVAMPAVSTISFSPIGMPCNGPLGPSFIMSASALRASASARSSVGRMNACSAPSIRCIRSRHACVSSTGDSFFAAIRAAASARVGMDITDPPP